MKIRLQEIELGVKDIAESHKFYSSILGFEASVQNPYLRVFQSGNPGLDFNVSTHIEPKATVVSFITNDITEVIKKLQKEGVEFEGPKKSHLGMHSIHFTDPDGNLVRVNEAGNDSPQWLRV